MTLTPRTGTPTFDHYSENLGVYGSVGFQALAAMTDLGFGGVGLLCREVLRSITPTGFRSQTPIFASQLRLSGRNSRVHAKTKPDGSTPSIEAGSSSTSAPRPSIGLTSRAS